MIKRIKIKNFLSLKDIDLELGPRNVLVGPNMSGKSNLIECLKFLHEALGSRGPQATVTALHQAFDRRGGFSEVAWKGQTGEVLSIELAADLPESEGRPLRSYRYDFSVSLGQFGYPEVESESLTLKRGGKSVVMLEVRDRKMRVTRGTSISSDESANTSALELERVSHRLESPEFKDFVASWNFYHLVPTLMRESNPPTTEKRLAEHGENLSAWLLTLQTYTDEFRRIKQACRDVLPGLDELLFQPVDAKKSGPAGGLVGTIPPESAKISVGASEPLLKRPVNISRMSDGELAFLALMSLILSPEELIPPVLCIEEPENHLHPRLLEIFVEILTQRQAELGPRAFQVILTTHSPLLVDKLGIDDLIVFGKEDAATKATRASSKKHLRQLLSRKETSLGDLWYSGALSDC